MSRTLKQISELVNNVERLFFQTFLRPPPPPEYLPILVTHDGQSVAKLPAKPFSIQEIFDGFLWGVPTHRRTVEKRWCRKYGAKNWDWKILTPKFDIKTCLNCGHHHEAGRLCPHCYGNVKAETTAMQEAMVNEFGLRPVDKEVAVLYNGEKEQVPDDFLQSKRVVEMKKPRPAWFTKNLLQKAITPESESSEAVKPSQLG
nr:EOG090X0IGM [Triops cancriformis]